MPGELPGDVLSSWVDVVGPWTGTVVLTTGRETAADLTRALLGDHAPAELEDEDIADAFGEIANVVGGNVKAALPGPSALSLPDVGAAPAVRNPADVCRDRRRVARRGPLDLRAGCTARPAGPLINAQPRTEHQL